MTNNKLIGTYQNGNYEVNTYSDGTKIRKTEENTFLPFFPENIDCKITDHCDGNCPFCYENCSQNGKHANLNQAWIESLHPFTELAINGNDLSHPDLISFLKKLKEKQIITNITINQKHFIKNTIKLLKWQNENLIHGIGISLNEVNYDLLSRIKPFQNLIIHTINGIITKENIEKLSNQNVKLLILGYKTTGKGLSYYQENKNKIDENVYYLKQNIEHLFNKFNVISFDNLAIEQLNIKKKLPKETWDTFYMGDDGSFTFYIDMVNQTFSKNSIQKNKTHPILPNVEEMFKQIQKEKEKKL